MALKLPTLDQTSEIVTSNGKPSIAFHRWWQKFSRTLSKSVSDIEANVLEIQQVLGLVEDTREIVDNGLNPDGTVKDDKVLNSSILAGAVLTTPGGNVTGSTTLTTGSYTWADCGQVTVTLSGVETTIRVDFDTEVVDNCKFSYRLLCDGVQLGRDRGPISVNTADEPGYTITRRHTPSSGSRVYKLQCAVNDANDIIIHDPIFDITENKNV
jgi:hypothetical protein